VAAFSRTLTRAGFLLDGFYALEGYCAARGLNLHAIRTPV
jgi:hypothetical protein